MNGLKVDYRFMIVIWLSGVILHCFGLLVRVSEAIKIPPSVSGCCVTFG